MSEYTRVYNEAKVAQEKIANGEKVTKAEVVAANKGKLIESLDEIDSKYSKQERTEPNFFEKYEKEVQDALVGLQHSKGTAAYKRQELLEWKKAFFKAYDEAPEGKKESVVAGLTDEQRLLCLSIITNNKFCDDTKLKEILQNFGVKVEDVRFLAKACENGQVNSENFANYAAAACSVHEDNFKQDPDSDKVTDSRNAMREIAENFGTLGSDATKVYDSMYCSSDDEVVDTAASNIYRMDKSSQDYATDKINQNDNAEKAKHHASLALNAANEVNAHDSLLNIQKGFNSGNNESTRQATIEFTANIKDAEIQDLFDKNNFEATEALEDKEMAARLHQLRIDEMPKWDVKVQESAFQRTMDSKYSEIRDYAAKNISRLDPTVQKAALDTVYNSRNNQAAEKTITVALQQTEKMPAVVQQEEIARIVLEEISVTAPKESDDFIKKYSNGELSHDEISKLSAADRKKYYDVMFKKASFSDKIKMLKNVSGNNAKYIFNMLCRYGDTALITNMVLSEGMGADIIKSGVAPDVRNKIVSILKRSSSNEAISQVEELRSDKSYAALFEDYTFGQNSKIEIKS